MCPLIYDFPAPPLDDTFVHYQSRAQMSSQSPTVDRLARVIIYIPRGQVERLTAKTPDRRKDYQHRAFGSAEALAVMAPALVQPAVSLGLCLEILGLDERHQLLGADGQDAALEAGSSREADGGSRRLGAIGTVDPEGLGGREEELFVESCELVEEGQVLVTADREVDTDSEHLQDSRVQDVSTGNSIVLPLGCGSDAPDPKGCGPNGLRESLGSMHVVDICAMVSESLGCCSTTQEQKLER